MVMWPALTLIGFVVLTALVVAMGMQSTARYEREKRSAVPAPARQTAAEPVGATPA
jgi:energy-converting hydrogenase Eha subunit F